MKNLIQHKQALWVVVGLSAIALMAVAGWTMVNSLPSLGSTSHALYPTDPTDDRKLAGLSEDVFFGQVTEKTGQTRERGLPETQYQVTVLEALKGRLSGTVTLNQQGGSHADGSSFRMEGDPALLEAGKSYLFVTRSSSEKGWHTNVPGYGNLLLDVPDNASANEVLSSEDAKRLRARFTDAVANEVPYDPKK